MTAIDDRETSAHDSLPIELYEFLGSYKNYYLTTDAEDVQFRGYTFESIKGMKRNNFKAGTNTEDKITAKVTLPIQNDIIADYGFQVTPPKLELNVYRVYRDLLPYEDNFRLYWRGPVSNINIKGNNATLDVPSIFSNALGGSCPSVYYQTPCNFVLYDPDTCKVSRVANSVSTLVADVQNSGQVIRLDSLGAFDNQDFIGGELLIPSQNERRMIIGVDPGTGTLTLNYPFGRVTQATPVQVTRGCDHAWKGHCKSRFNNTENFGGHPLIPALNIFETGF